jgi:hypothetical protein
MEKVAISVLINNNILNASGLARFTYIPSGRHLLVFHLDEKSLQNGKELNKIYVTETGNKNSEFIPIPQDEWQSIKDAIQSMAVPNVDFTRDEYLQKIQLSTLEPTQYVVGPYKKVAVTDDMLANILNNQLMQQPKEVAVQPTGNIAFFDQSVMGNDQTVQQNLEQPAIPNAFTMQAPVQQQVVQTVPVQQVPVQPTMQQVPMQPVQMAQQVPVQQPVQFVQQPQMVQTVPVQPVQPQIIQTVPVQQVPMQEQAPIALVNNNTLPVLTDDEKNKVVSVLKVILPQTGADTTQVNNILRANNYPEISETLNINQQQSVAVQQPSVIDINNLPVAAQAPVAEENVIHEEAFVPTTPSVPVDTMTPVQNTVLTEPVQQQVVEQPAVQPAPVQQAPVAPVTQEVVQPTVVENQNTIVQPVEPQSTIVQPVESQTTIVQPVETQTTLVQPVEAPQQIIEQPTATTTDTPVETTVTPIVDNTVAVQTELVQPTSVMPANPVQTDMIQNTTVNIPIPEESTISTPPSINTGIPEIQPITNMANTQLEPVQVEPQVTEPVQPTVQPIEPVQPVNQMPSLDVPTIDLSNVQSVSTPTGENTVPSFLDAGPVVVPDGQSNVQSIGLPGDSGAKILEKSA